MPGVARAALLLATIVVLLGQGAPSYSQSLRIDLDSMKPSPESDDSVRNKLRLPTLDLAVGAERAGTADVTVAVVGGAVPDSDGRYDSPFGKYRVIAPMDGVALREADGSRAIAVATRIEVLSKDYEVPSIYVVTLSTTVDGEGAGDVIIEGARIDPEDPDGKRTLDPFRLLLPAQGPQ